MTAQKLSSSDPAHIPVGGRETLPARVRSIASAKPASPALHWNGTTLTYGELEARSASIADHLQFLGAQRGDAVGICLDRSFGQVIACLGAMRIGCAFALLDPDDPVERRSTLLSNATIQLLIATPEHIGGHRGSTLLIDLDGRVVDRRPQAMPAADPPPAEPASPGQVPAGSDIAYIVHTSGTTGTPKGVEITHANLVNLINWHVGRFGVTEADRASQIAGPAFDAAIWEVWPYLSAGASVALADETVRRSPTLLRAWLLREGITISFVPTTLAESMLAEAWPDDCALRYLLTGGDALRVRPHPDAPFRLVNNYGPCECTVVTTSGDVDAEAPSGEVPDIGRPIDGVVVHILDDEGLPVEDGVEGDIWIGGKSVGRGYRNRPDLTLAAFVPDPFGPDPLGDLPDAMIYRSGDRGVRMKDGRIAFRGRRDDQVKVRGVRIEVDEVACVLARHHAVAAAIVVPRTDHRGEVALCAYYVSSASDLHVSAGDLRTFAARRLPATHLPSDFVHLEAMPLTSNGKIDKGALPPPPPPDTSAQDHGAPATATQARLVGIIGQVLGIGELPIDADFFLMGGHSLLASQVVIQAREAFEVDLALRDLFESPTVEGLAEVVESRMAERVASLSDEEVRTMLAVR